jgi:hypothetical protein
VPDEFVRAAGTTTWYPFDASNVRKGRSRVTGLVTSVVYGGFGKALSSGRPTTPRRPGSRRRSTTADAAVRDEELLLGTVDRQGRLESAMKPPLAYCGPRCSSP